MVVGLIDDLKLGPHQLKAPGACEQECGLLSCSSGVKLAFSRGI